MSGKPFPAVHWPPGWGPEQCDSFISHERRIAASAGAVFDRLIAIEAWSTWQREVQRTDVSGEVSVGSSFVVVAPPDMLDGVVGELARPYRFGWIGIGESLSFYQSWLLLDQPGGETLAIFREAARGPAALMRADRRFEQTRGWLDALLPSAVTPPRTQTSAGGVTVPASGQDPAGAAPGGGP